MEFNKLIMSGLKMLGFQNIFLGGWKETQLLSNTDARNDNLQRSIFKHVHCQSKSVGWAQTNKSTSDWEAVSSAEYMYKIYTYFNSSNLILRFFKVLW
jgi:hypothetical protein